MSLRAVQYGAGPIGALVVETAVNRNYEFVGAIDIDPGRVGVGAFVERFESAIASEAGHVGLRESTAKNGSRSTSACSSERPNRAITSRLRALPT